MKEHSAITTIRSSARPEAKELLKESLFGYIVNSGIYRVPHVACLGGRRRSV